MDNENLIAVRDYARKIHNGQLRKGGDPYFHHVVEVEELCRELFDGNQLGLQGDDERFNVLATALLHDSIEDTAADYEDIEHVSNRQVADWVKLLSEDKRKPKIIRRREYLEVLGASCSVVQAIKLADIYSNVTGITFREENDWIKRYLELSLEVIERLRLVKELDLYFKCLDAISVVESKLTI
ncbi:bifunctional (p)ppGpp synthetase/guanosine-3',5'-bis(diphosphate) 3'-pyrophosphohydrolase [Pikeienuella piscinae]|uniref:Bifunctional (P)ppGpp synthetase/guanosine-3',5'-bis(Diphosphate) 3'-pyrophosphohydrolase n=1 Tax=Pikeienuella piscinae TaxID=2748098 RepID=A0A7L5BWK6_9RHOB|nr:HD domain-containing protein [Pikeienuella piscinae]QIE56102.1 bifunctional (p)ppGpp synthetase/guanosine-3',5'-bis(diphosphate) 3'-pyrophosphohydrolase [Pikeienuella piscinae]